MSDDRYAQSVLVSCQAVHMSLAGSAVLPLPALERDSRLEWLRSRLDDWRPGLGSSEAYDEAVKSVVVAVLAEAERAGHEPIMRQRDTLPAPVPSETVARLAALETKLSTARAVVASCKKFCGPSCAVCREQIAAALGES